MQTKKKQREYPLAPQTPRSDTTRPLSARIRGTVRAQPVWMRVELWRDAQEGKRHPGNQKRVAGEDGRHEKHWAASQCSA